jgi:hypothetical protein
MAKIEKIIIDVEGKIDAGGKLVITLDEAKSLKAALDELLEPEEKITYIPYQPYIQPYTIPYNPYPTITWCENGLRTTSGGSGRVGDTYTSAPVPVTYSISSVFANENENIKTC